MLTLVPFLSVIYSSSETGRTKGTGFIGSLTLEGIATVVLVTAHHVVPDMKTARSSKFIFSCIDGSTVTVDGSDLIDKPNDVHKMCPKEVV